MSITMQPSRAVLFEWTLPNPRGRPSNQQSPASHSQSKGTQSRLGVSSAPFVQQSQSNSFVSFTAFREDLVNLFSTLVDVPASVSVTKHDAYEMCKVLLELCTVRFCPISHLEHCRSSRPVIIVYAFNIHRLESFASPSLCGEEET